MTARRVTTIALAIAIAVPGIAQAHAVLEDTSPGQGSTVREQPDSVSFRFDEPVEASFGAVRVFDARGEQVESGEAFRPGGDGRAIATRLEPGLADGTYTATYHVISADSHPVSGGFTFAIGKPTPGGGKSVAAVLDDESTGSITGAAIWLDRALGYLAIALAAGGLVFLAAVWRRALAGAADARAGWLEASAALERRARLIVGIAIAVGLAASLLALPLQVANASGVSLWEALNGDALRDVLSTRYGTVFAVRAAAWAALGAIAIAVVWRRPAGALRPATLGATGTVSAAPMSRAALVASGLAAAVLVATPALAGHAATQNPSWLLTAAAVVHVGAMSVWLGGLVLLALALPAATRRLELADRTRLLWACLARFSPLALACVVAVAASGTVQAIVEVGSFPALVDTGFGRAVLAKIVLFALLCSLGYANRNRLIPALRTLVERGASAGRPGLAVRRNLRLEVGLLAAVIGVTAVLVGYAPASESAAGPVSGRATVGAEVLEYTIEPAVAGPNSVHLYLFDAEDGSQYDAAREVSAQLTEPDRGIGPLDVDLRRAGAGHYTAPGTQIGAPGDWQLEVTVRTSRFSEDSATIEVPVR